MQPSGPQVQVHPVKCALIKPLLHDAERMCMAAQANREGESYGSTATVALQLGAHLYIAYAGAAQHDPPCFQQVLPLSAAAAAAAAAPAAHMCFSLNCVGCRTAVLVN